ncbi:MAG: hypothetical protein ABSF48_23005 [Thermodesulfobacteriota bacterium]
MDITIIITLIAVLLIICVIIILTIRLRGPNQMKTWIHTYGSADLKEIYKKGKMVREQYVHERLIKEIGGKWINFWKNPLEYFIKAEYKMPESDDVIKIIKIMKQLGFTCRYCLVEGPKDWKYKGVYANEARGNEKIFFPIEYAPDKKSETIRLISWPFE